MSAPLHTEKTIFLEAAEIASPTERAAFLERSCGDDRQLRAAVEALLLSHQRSQGVLDATSAPLAEHAGTIIGPYKLLEQIGEGGMGTVFMAEQTHPVQRKVALKVIKPGMDTRQVIARFEAERQALAMMDHVNIARVLDAGATEAGRPYFVMELVHGVPITKYCDENRLTPRERLELFVPVCQAIQHAHQKGIIHRDIKPSNVMITLYDGQPVPKVIDFGVAKATEQKLTERTLFTQFGTMVGTLEYMSPEQAEMSALGVDTRSDIYSLGVLLYELLTGSTPLSRKRVREAAYAEVLRLIKEEEPPKPSTRLSDSGEALASISAQRHMEPAKLSKLMRGELDWIVMKTLEKDRNRRYETANGFATDVQRYLHDEPVQACPPSARYRLLKFARRNRVAMMTTGFVALVLVAGTVVSAWQAIRATRARQEAEVARTEEAAQRTVADHRRIEADDQRAEANHQRNIAEDHLQETRLQQAIAEKNQVLAEKSHQQARRAVEQLFVLVGDDLVLNEPEFQPLRSKLLRTALGYYQEFIEIWKDVPAKRSELAASYRHVAQLSQQMGAQKVALSAGKKALDLQLTLVNEEGDDSRRIDDLASTWLNLGLSQQSAGRHIEAAKSYDQALALWQPLAEKDPAEARYQSGLAAAYHNLGWLRSELQLPKEAVRCLRQALAIRERLVKEYPDNLQYKFLLAGTYGTLGNRLREADQWEDAVALQSKALAVFRELVKNTGARADLERGIGSALNSIGDVHRENRREAGWAEKALAAYAEARTIQERLLQEHPTSIDVQSNLANTLINTGQVHRSQKNYTVALQMFDAAIALLDRMARVNPTGVNDLSALAMTYCEKGRVLASLDHPDDAAAAYQQAIACHEKVIGLAPSVKRYQRELALFRQELERVQRKN
jgi:serine/threonine protein kinase/tetratricopeptide (TPR) repeat protein